MASSDQVGISGSGSGTQTASLGNYLRKLDESFIKTSERKMEGGIEMSDFEKNKYKKLKKKYGNEFSSSIGTDTKVASSLSSGSYGGYIDAGESRGFVSQEQAERMLANPERYKMRPSEIRYLRGSMPGIKGVDASKSKIYSDSPQTLGGTEGSLIAMANTDNRGITTAAPETKVKETTRMAGGFFSPQNFQRSGVPDATIMTGEQMRQSIFGDPGYKRFGTLDRPGTQAAKDTAAFNQRVKSDFFSPVKADARSIAERREANEQSIRDTAAENYQAFKDRGGRPAPTTRISGDDTYGTNVMSNPAFGFRSKMSDENKTRYDASAKEATRRSEVEPSKGNLIQSTLNIGKRIFNTAIGASEGTPLTKEVALQKRGEAEQVRYEKYLNRPMYQREATARVEAGITPQMTKEKNQAQMRADAAARDAAFQANRRAATVERVARRTPENTGTGRDGTFGAGTTGRGMPSNPQGVRQQGVGVSANNLSRHSPGTSKDQPSAKRQQAVKKAQTQKKQSGGGFGGGVGNPTNRRGSGVSNRSSATKKSAPSTKKSSTSTSTNKRAQAAAKRRASQSKAKAAKKSKSKSSTSKSSKSKSSKSSRAGSSRGRAAAKGRTRRGRRGRRCDIRCKYNIMLLTNMNLVKDDLAEVAYFVKELQA